MLNKLLHKTKTKFVTNSQGFTLIELLIVIVIIGILAGVLIAVIDPAAQQNRARDATIRATLNKVALATSGYISAYGRIPDEIEFQAGISGFADSNDSATCGTTQTADCLFWISALNANNTCATAANAWTGSASTDTDPCNMRYCGGDNAQANGACTWTATTSQYRLAAKGYGSANVFMYRSSDSKMYLCNGSGAACTTL